MKEEINAAKAKAEAMAKHGYSADVIAAALNGLFGGLYLVAIHPNGSKVYRRNDNDYAPDILIWG